MLACNQRNGNVLEYRPIMRVSFHTVSSMVPVYCGNRNRGGGRRMAVLSSGTPTTYGAMSYGTKRAYIQASSTASKGHGVRVCALYLYKPG